jgi:uncharacterized integral membrane protein
VSVNRVSVRKNDTDHGHGHFFTRNVHMRLLSYIFCIILIIFGISFSVLNSTEVPVNYFFGQKTIYFPLLSLFLIIIGAILGIIAMLPVCFRRRDHKKINEN